MEFNAKFDKDIGKWYPMIGDMVYDDIGFDEPVTAHQVANIIKGELNANKKTVD